jgi:hypothetical protein
MWGNSLHLGKHAGEGIMEVGQCSMVALYKAVFLVMQLPIWFTLHFWIIE